MNDALRQHRRCPVNVIARIRLDPEEEFEARCATDLSLGGLQMVLDQELEEGHRVQLEFRPLQRRGRIETTAVVRWCRPQGQHYAAGLEFIEMDEPSRDRFEEALELLEESSKPGAVRCLSEAVIETTSVEEFARSYGAELSEARLRVETDEPFRPGEQLLVEVRLPDDEPVFRADSIVCSSEESEDGYTVSVRFWYLDEPSRRFLEQVDGVLEPDRSTARWKGIDEEAWFEEGDLLGAELGREIPKAVVRKWPIPPRLGLGMAGIGSMAAAALALFVLFRGPAVEGLPSVPSLEGIPSMTPAGERHRTESDDELRLHPFVWAPASYFKDTALSEKPLRRPFVWAPASYFGDSTPPMEPRRRPFVWAPASYFANASSPQPMIAPAPIARPGEAGRVLAIRATPGKGNRIEIVSDVELTGRFETQVLDNPPRFVVDIQGVKRGDSLQAGGRVGSLIRRYRVGRHPDMVRVVLDLAADAPLLVSAEGTRLVVATN